MAVGTEIKSKELSGQLITIQNAPLTMCILCVSPLFCTFCTRIECLMLINGICFSQTTDFTYFASVLDVDEEVVCCVQREGPRSLHGLVGVSCSGG